MIRYNTASVGSFRLIFWIEGSVYLATLVHSIVASIFALGFVFLRDKTDEKVFQVFEETFAYSVLTFVLGFVLVFRCQLAYSRFWVGREALETMTNNWTDALIKMVSFDKYSDLPSEDVVLWRHKMVSYFSLLHATALSSLHDYQSTMEVLQGVDQTMVINELNSVSVYDVQQQLSMAGQLGRLLGQQVENHWCKLLQ